MSPRNVGDAGRIHKNAFIISALVLFIICLISVSARLYIRLRIQRQFGLDDAFVLFGTGCLIAAVGLLFHFLNKMYLVEALLFPVPGVEITFSPNFIKDSFRFHKTSIIALELTWCSLVTVKFGFLVLFKRLLDRMKSMLWYWWFTMIFNAAVAAYGIAVYVAACPDFNSLGSFSCGVGSRVDIVFKFALSQMIVDIVGDLLILFIPCRLIWKIKVKWAQKVALASCLCLSIFVIICTIIRAAGLRNGHRVDFVWETYWQFIAASTGLSMTAAAAFRSMFVSHQSNQREEQHGSNSSIHHWVSYIKTKLAIGKLFSLGSRRSSPKSLRDSGSSTVYSNEKPDIGLGDVERGTITGLQTFIHGYGQTQPISASQVMRSQTLEETNECEGHWPLSDDEQGVRKTTTISCRSDEVIPSAAEQSRKREHLSATAEKTAVGSRRVGRQDDIS